MSFAKFFNIIDASPVGKIVEAKRKQIEKTDPSRIYVENIRNFFHIPTKLASVICEQAVREGIFEKHYGYICPNPNCRRVVVSSDIILPPDEELTCQACEDDEQGFEFKAGDVSPLVFYSLKTDSSEHQ